MGSLWGHWLQVSSFGESHGPGVGVVIHGCPSGLSLDMESLQRQLHRRRPGTSPWVSSRGEKDELSCLSGLEEGRTLGSPLSFFVANKDVRRRDYSSLQELYNL